MTVCFEPPEAVIGKPDDDSGWLSPEPPKAVNGKPTDDSGWLSLRSCLEMLGASHSAERVRFLPRLS